MKPIDLIPDLLHNKNQINYQRSNKTASSIITFQNFKLSKALKTLIIFSFFILNLTFSISIPGKDKVTLLIKAHSNTNQFSTRSTEPTLPPSEPDHNQTLLANQNQNISTSTNRSIDNQDPKIYSANHPLTGSIQKRLGQDSNQSSSADPSKTQHGLIFDLQAALIPILVILSGIFAGLTLGYMSLDSTQLIVLSKSGTTEQQELAKKIAPLRKDGHLLLITLLMANMIANEALPVVSENVMGGGIQAIVISTVLVIIFSEIIPQSVCATHGLKIGAACAKPVKGLVYLFYPIAWPIARLLTKLLGEHSGVIYRRAELKELVNLHGQQGDHGGDLAADVVTIVRGALDLQERVVADSMKALDTCFMLNIETKLDFKTLNHILESGHSRIPVYESVQTKSGPKRKIIGALLTKQLILIDPEDGLPLREFPLNPLPIVSSDMPLLNILNCFQEGRSHLAIVSHPQPPPPFSPRIPTVLSSASSSSLTSNLPTTRTPSPQAADPNSHTKKAGVKPWSRWFKSKKADIVNGRSIKHEDEESNFDKAHGTPSSLEPMAGGAISIGLTGSKGMMNSKGDQHDGVDQEPIGIISLEDVLEQLLGEPIYDETDQDGSGKTAVRPFLPPEAIEALKINNTTVLGYMNSDEENRKLIGELATDNTTATTITAPVRSFIKTNSASNFIHRGLIGSSPPPQDKRLELNSEYKKIKLEAIINDPKLLNNDEEPSFVIEEEAVEVHSPRTNSFDSDLGKS